jgi:uncharacterized membrane protein YcaP (DUF421 family)
MDLLVVAARVLFSYLVLLALLRAGHKRSVAESTPFDFVLALVLGDMIDDLLWGEAGAAMFIVGVGGLALAHSLVALGSYHSRTFHRLVDSPPTVLVQDGRLVARGMRRELLNEGEVEELMRLQGVDPQDRAEIEVMRMEGNGRASVTRRRPAREARKPDVEAP